MTVSQPFESIYRTHEAGVRRCVARLGLPSYARSDIEQEVWITALRRRADLVAHPNPGAWLRSVARHHAMHFLRSQVRYYRKLAAAAVDTPARHDPYGDRDAWDTLATLLRDCPLEQREVYLRIELYGESAAEIAEDLGVSVNTVHSRLRLSRQRLREVGPALAALLLTLRRKIGEDVCPGPATSPAGTFQSTSSPSSSFLRIAYVAGLMCLSPGTDPIRAVDATVTQLTIAGNTHKPDPSVHGPVRLIPWRLPTSTTGTPGSTTDATTSPGTTEESSTFSVPTTSPPSAPLSHPHATRRAPTTATKPRRMAPADDGQYLLQEAHDAYRRKKFPLAIRLLQQHRERFPGSEMWLSREATLILALCGANRTDEARRNLRAFPLENPDAWVFRGRLRDIPAKCR